ncbi:VOC family protein [Microbispora sp. NPDC046933]|uniref:VOC family protein n=1 Tax=Microbispora sp. NPDC046933 TaxID=3155618 RepID=UPI0033D7F85E
MPDIADSYFRPVKRRLYALAMPERLITHLRHVDFAVPDFRKYLDFYENVWGLTLMAGDTGVAFLAAEGSPEQYVIRLREDTVKRLDLLAFGAETPADVDELAERLGAAGVTLVSEPGTLTTPGGGYGFRFFDGDGRTVEVSADVAPRAHRKVEKGESIPVRLSHLVVNSPAPEATRAWYETHLGFALSDTLWSRHMGDLMYFMRCNPRHHSFAIARGPHVSVHHTSFELRGVDEYMYGTGRVLRSGHRMVWGPGRHLAGENTFSYFIDPAGNTVEYTTDLQELDEDLWHPHVYDVDDPMTQDQWGTANPMNELVAKESFNDVDRGVFVAPPV